MISRGTFVFLFSGSRRTEFFSPPLGIDLGAITFSPLWPLSVFLPLLHARVHTRPHRVDLSISTGRVRLHFPVIPLSHSSGPYGLFPPHCKTPPQAWRPPLLSCPGGFFLLVPNCGPSNPAPLGPPCVATERSSKWRKLLFGCELLLFTGNSFFEIISIASVLRNVRSPAPSLSPFPYINRSFVHRGA